MWLYYIEGTRREFSLAYVDRSKWVVEMVSRRLVITLVFLTGVTSGGCAQMLADTANETFDSAFPDGKWDPVPLSDLVASEDHFKDKRMRFHLESGGQNIAMVERIDSTFVYAWIDWDDNIPRHLTKIRLQKVTGAELWVEAAEQFETRHWIALPFVIVIAVIIAAVLSLGWVAW